MYTNREKVDKNLIETGLSLQSIKNSGPNIGDRVKVRTKLDKHTMYLEGTVIEDYPFFFNVKIDTVRWGFYIISINKIDMLTKLNMTDVRIA